MTPIRTRDPKQLLLLLLLVVALLSVAATAKLGRTVHTTRSSHGSQHRGASSTRRQLMMMGGSGMSRNATDGKIGTGTRSASKKRSGSIMGASGSRSSRSKGSMMMMSGRSSSRSQHTAVPTVDVTIDGTDGDFATMDPFDFIQTQVPGDDAKGVGDAGKKSKKSKKAVGATDTRTGTADGATTHKKDKMTAGAKAAGRVINMEEDATGNNMEEEEEATSKRYGPSKPLHIRSKLVFTFFEGKGRQPSADEIEALETGSITFFSDRFGTDAKFADVFQELKMQKLVPKYDEAVPDEFTLEFMTTVLVDVSAQVTAHQAADVIASSKFKKYINDYVRKITSSESNEFFDTIKVFFKGVTPNDNSPTDQQ